MSTRRRPQRSDIAPSHGAHTNCISAYSPKKAPKRQSSSSARPTARNRPGKMGNVNPMPMPSSTTVVSTPISRRSIERCQPPLRMKSVGPTMPLPDLSNISNILRSWLTNSSLEIFPSPLESSFWNISSVISPWT